MIGCWLNHDHYYPFPPMGVGGALRRRKRETQVWPQPLVSCTVGAGAEDPGSSQRTAPVKALSSLVTGKKSLKGFFKASTIRSLTEINFSGNVCRWPSPRGHFGALPDCLWFSGHPVTWRWGLGWDGPPPLPSPATFLEWSDLLPFFRLGFTPFLV